MIYLFLSIGQLVTCLISGGVGGNSRKRKRSRSITPTCQVAGFISRQRCFLCDN